MMCRGSHATASITVFLVALSTFCMMISAGNFVSGATSSVASAAKSRSSPHRKPWGTCESAFVRSPSFDEKAGECLSDDKVEETDDEMNPLVMSDPPRRIIIMGGPASGKGTQCEWISSRYNLVHLSTGDILRGAVAKDSSPGSIGALAQRYMDSGQLVPDEIIIHVLKERIMQPDCQKQGYLLDGFPRTRVQAQALLAMGIRPDTFIFIDVPDELLIERVIGRRLDPVDGKIYHTIFNPPPDAIKERLITRSDDNEEKAWKRLRQFHENVSSVKQCFQDIIVQVDGSSPPAIVAQSIRGLLEQPRSVSAAV